MRFKHVWIVVKKEIKDIIRDKKTVITSILVPMILLPGLNILVGGGIEKMQKDVTENVTITLTKECDNAQTRELVEKRILNGNPNLKLVIFDNYNDALDKEKARAALDIEKDWQSKMDHNQPFKISILYNKGSKSEGSIALVASAIENFNKEMVVERLNKLGIDPSILQPVTVEQKDVGKPEKQGNMMLMMLLPLFIAIFMATGGIAAAVDLVAGEKERNTFEPLLTTQPSRSSILIGKYITISIFSITTVASSLLGLFIGYLLNPNALTMGTGGNLGGFSIEPGAAILAVIITITLGMTFSGLQIALSTYAKSFKEAQTYLSFLMIAAMIPAYMTMMSGPNDLSAYMFTIPVFSTVASLKMVLGGIINYGCLFVALGTSLIYVAMALFLATWLFKRENVLFRS